MKNRAKCKLCNSIIESLTIHDHVSCACGEISVDGGVMYYKASAKDFKNFLRIDDNGNEMPVQYAEEKKCMQNETLQEIKSEKEELMSVVDGMIDDFERLPEHAKSHPMTQYDYCALLMLVKSFLEIVYDEKKII